MDIVEEQYHHLNEDENKIIICHFEVKYLETIQPLLQRRIVEFDLTQNKSQDVFESLFAFIKNYSHLWKGLELNFRYQNKYLPQKTLKLLSNAIDRMEDLTTLSISFGGHIVSQYYAENHKSSNLEWDKCTNGLQKNYDNYKELLQQFSKIAILSPNLKKFCLDFQGLGQDCVFMLGELTSINQSLVQCTLLEEYIFSLNHCSMYNDSKGTLSTFLNSFIFLKEAKYLKKFIFNIADWDLSLDNFQILGKIFGEYLTYEKISFEEFQFDHSSNQELDHQNHTEIQILTENLNKLLDSHRHTLKTFYLSLVQYNGQTEEIEIFMTIFSTLSQCLALEKLSLRIQCWRSMSILTEEKFYRQLALLKNVLTLKQFHLSTFKTALKKSSPNFQYGNAIMDIMGRKSIIYHKQIVQSKMISKYIKSYYRSQILEHLNELCNPSDIETNNKSFQLTQF